MNELNVFISFYGIPLFILKKVP